MYASAIAHPEKEQETTPCENTVSTEDKTFHLLGKWKESILQMDVLGLSWGQSLHSFWQVAWIQEAIFP